MKLFFSLLCKESHLRHELPWLTLSFKGGFVLQLKQPYVDGSEGLQDAQKVIWLTVPWKLNNASASRMSDWLCSKLGSSPTVFLPVLKRRWGGCFLTAPASLPWAELQTQNTVIIFFFGIKQDALQEMLGSCGLFLSAGLQMWYAVSKWARSHIHHREDVMSQLLYSRVLFCLVWSCCRVHLLLVVLCIKLQMSTRFSVINTMLLGWDGAQRDRYQPQTPFFTGLHQLHSFLIPFRAHMFCVCVLCCWGHFVSYFLNLNVGLDFLWAGLMCDKYYSSHKNMW